MPIPFGKNKKKIGFLCFLAVYWAIKKKLGYADGGKKSTGESSKYKTKYKTLTIVAQHEPGKEERSKC